MKQMNIIYLRCSSSLQDTAHQEASILDYCKRNNIDPDRIIRDEGISAYRKDISARDGFLEILDMAREGMVDNLIVFETSRISRNFIEGQTVVDTLSQCNVKIHSVTDNSIINESELNQLMNAFKFFFNQKASQETGKRVKSAHELLRQQGKWAAGSIPYGYVLIDGYAVIDEELAPEIITMFEDYINYDSKYVQDKYGIKNRKTLIDRISHPMIKEIVGDDLFIRANKIKDSRRCSKKSSASNLNRTDVLFEGLLYHKHCSHKLYLNRDYRSKGKPHSYRCKECRGDETITNKKSFSGTKLDAHIEKQILDILDSLDHDALVEKYNSRCTKKQAIIELKLRELDTTHKTKMRALQLGKTRLTESILNNAPSVTIDAISNMINDVSVELADIEEQLNLQRGELEHMQQQAIHQEAIIADILNARDIYKSAGIQQKKAILQMLVNRIEVADVNDVDIYLNI